MKKILLKKVVLGVMMGAMLITPCSLAQASDMDMREAKYFSKPYGVQLEPYIEYAVHIQNTGDLSPVTSGMVGGNGKGLRMEQVAVTLKNAPADSYVQLNVHMQDVGWSGPSSKNGQPMGSKGLSRRIEAIQASLKGSISDNYKLYYRVHCEELGDLCWVQEGQKAGSEGCEVAIESVEFKLVPKSEAGPTTSSAGGYFTKPKLSATSHIANVGDQNYTEDSNGVLMVGSTGQSNAIEGLDLNLTDILVNRQAISQKLHIQDLGWEKNFTTGMSGTRGRSLRSEAVEIALSGNVAKLYDVEIQPHVQDKGWLNWSKFSAGTTGESLRLEALRIRLVRKAQTKSITSGVIDGSSVNSGNLHTGKVNGKTISTSIAARSGYCACGKSIGVSGHWCCWNYAANAYKEIWGVGSFHQSQTNNDMLRAVCASNRRTTVDNLRKYLSKATPGANVRFDTDTVNSNRDSNGHSMIFCGLDSSGNGAYWLDANYNGKGVIQYRYISFSELVSAKGKYSYIKYIMFPGAPAI